ncbi:hypothetical protein KFK09_012475 [Dendrobium nobile]|uniref:Uncharacterized protein n=1 Tax=Dendrobium nobile TaxID=94219 RepID=A0A8T3BJ06_DENNO|nr:hypothetical protein KFK09_012475 [Dendrobium nobile]
MGSWLGTHWVPTLCAGRLCPPTPTYGNFPDVIPTHTTHFPRLLNAVCHRLMALRAEFSRVLLRFSAPAHGRDFNGKRAKSNLDVGAAFLRQQCYHRSHLFQHGALCLTLIRVKSPFFFDMSGAPKVRSMNVADSEARPVLGPAGNKARSTSAVARKAGLKPLRKIEGMRLC